MIADMNGTLDSHFKVSTFVQSTSASSGGDFAGWIALTGGSTAILLGDASGHGTDAAARASYFRRTVSEFFQAGVSPGSIARFMNRALYRRAPTGSIPWPFVSAFLAVVDRGGRTMRYTSCGHEGALLFSADSRHVRLLPNAPLLGVCEQATFAEERVLLPRHGALVLATDGITEARSEHVSGTFFGTSGLGDAFVANRHASAQHNGAACIITSAETHSHGALVDDAAAFVAEFP